MATLTRSRGSIRRRTPSSQRSRSARGPMASPSPTTLSGSPSAEEPRPTNGRSHAKNRPNQCQRFGNHHFAGQVPLLGSPGRSEMQFRILGPVEAFDDQGTPLPLGGGRQLALFALLLLNPNEVVSTDRLVDGLWTEEPPATAEKIVRNYVSLLRKQLGDRLVRRPPGYVLRVEPGELDSERFET